MLVLQPRDAHVADSAPRSMAERPRPKRQSSLCIAAARDRALLQRAQARGVRPSSDAMQVRLHCVQAIAHGEDAFDVARRTGVALEELQACCELINSAGADVFVSMLEAETPIWRASRDTARHADVALPTQILAQTPTRGTLQTPVEQGARRLCAQKNLPSAIHGGRVENLSASLVAILSFAEQDPDLLTPPAARTCDGYFEYVKSLPSLDMLEHDAQLWLCNDVVDSSDVA